MAGRLLKDPLSQRQPAVLLQIQNYKEPKTP